MQTKSLLISVIIPHLNQMQELQFCLDSLEAQTLGKDLFEVIVVDNGSQTLPPLGHRGFPIRLMQESEPGPGTARNRGAAEALGDILAFIDADCRADRNWLTNALGNLQSAPDKTILGGDVQIWRDDPNAFSALEAYESVFAYRFQLYIEKHGFCGTGNLVVKRQHFFDIGPFKGIEFAEDIEWGRMAHLAGYRFKYVPEMIVYHPARKSLKELFVKWDRHIQHYIHAARNRRHWRLYWIAKASAILVSPAVDWITVLRNKRIFGASARLNGIAVLTAVRTYRFFRMITALLASKSVAWNRGNLIKGADT